MSSILKRNQPRVKNVRSCKHLKKKKVNQRISRPSNDHYISKIHSQHKVVEGLDVASASVLNQRKYSFSDWSSQACKLEVLGEL